ncbi:hypothetical protein MH206_01635 [Bacillus altitudinis]|uniref:hypothetical protein n=1 Tax=Bacillus altitudinis TaxID=293387 RepID=UPI00227FB563|nr:hypothetical protein [Bacillus altitudinis]MCY7627740.1 hypothetical protein [Bacillus altitudinis]MDX2363620.1 hypothetical protein [Bacillus altitudinis]
MKILAYKKRGLIVGVAIVPIILALLFCIFYFFETGSKSHLFAGCGLFLILLFVAFVALMMFIAS